MKYSRPKVEERILKGDILVYEKHITIAGTNVDFRCSRNRVAIHSSGSAFCQNSIHAYNGWAERAFRKASK